MTGGLVVANASVSLDGFIAYDDNSIGDLFEWYDNGDVEVVNAGTLPPFHLTRASADHWNAWERSPAKHWPRDCSTPSRWTWSRS